MKTEKERIGTKIGEIQAVIDAMEGKRSLLARCGASIVQVERDLEYQRARVGWLQWCLDHDEQDIRSRVAMIEGQLGPDGLKAMALGAAGLPDVVVNWMSELSLLKLALEGR